MSIPYRLSRFRIIVLCLFVAMLLLYAFFPTRTHYWDGVLFALNIEGVHRDELPVGVLFHPNHLLYSALGYAFYQLFLACGLSIRAMTALQIANIALAALTAWIIFTFARRLTTSSWIAFFCAILFAFGATWWKFSTDADAYVIAVLFLLIAVQFVARERLRLLPAAVFQILAMLFHELAVFAYAPAIAAIIFDKQRSKGNRLLISCVYVISTAACVAAIYFVAYQYSDHTTYPSLLSWTTSRSTTSQTTHGVKQLGGYVLSYVKLFAGGKLSMVRDFFSMAEALAFAACLASIVWAVYLFRRPATKPASQVERRPVSILWAWLLPYAIFFVWWEPASAFYKLFVWPPIVLLIGIYAARQRPRGFLAIAFGLTAWNFGAFVFPHSHASADPVLALAKQIDGQLPKNATVYYEVFSPDDWYLAYFAPGRKWTKLPSAPHAQLESTTGPVCLETTALDRMEKAYGSVLAIDPALRWDLVNRQHNVRLECLKPSAISHQQSAPNHRADH